MAPAEAADNYVRLASADQSSRWADLFWANPGLSPHGSETWNPLPYVCLTRSAGDGEGFGGAEGEAALQTAGLAPATTSLDLASLNTAVRQFLDEVADSGRSLSEAMVGGAVTPWLWGAVAACLALELTRRYQRQAHAKRREDDLGSDPIFTWTPGMPGAFALKDA
jgi:hypothetical protein